MEKLLVIIVKISDCISFSLKTSKRNKHYKYTLLVFSLCTFLFMFGLTFRDNFVSYINNTITQNIGFRSLLVSPNLESEDYGLSKIKNIQHVVDVYSSNYDFASVLSDFKSEKYDGYIDLNYGSYATLPKNIIGESFDENDREVAICPINFYPSSEAVSLGLDENKILNGYDLLGKEFEITYYSYTFNGVKAVEDKAYTKKFTIIGLYNNEEVMTANNVCYVSANDIKEINNVGTLDDPENATVYGFVVVVDSKNNVSNVANELEKLGFMQPTVKNELDTSLVNTILLTCNILITIIMFGIIILSMFYIKKNIINNTQKIGLMMASGFTKKDIKKYYFIDNLIFSLLAFIVGFIVFLTIYILLKATLLHSLIYSGFIIKIFIIDILFTFFVIVIISSIISIYHISKITNKSIITLTGGDNYDS